MIINKKKILYSLILPLIIFIFHKFLSLSTKETTLIASLLLTIGLWMTNAIPKWISSFLLLFTFLIFSSAPLENILSFPFSKNFILIVFSYLFSEGLKKSGVFNLLVPIIDKVVKGKISLLITIALCSIIGIWAIPQPFARIIIFLELFNTLFDEWKLKDVERQVISLELICSMLIINCGFLRGDIILNNTLLSTSGFSLTSKEWTKFMLIPTAIIFVLLMLAYLFSFRKELDSFLRIKNTSKDTRNIKIDKTVLIVLVATIVLWLTEQLTGIHAAYTVVLATLALFVTKKLDIKDIKCINFELLIFLTAAFSIGPVMKYDGIAKKLLDIIFPILPSQFNILFAIALCVCCMTLHMILGSCVTALSVIIPSLMLLEFPDKIKLQMVLIAFLAIVLQFILPIHNSSIMVAEGKAGYTQGQVFKIGLTFTILELILIPVIYLNYWQLL